MACTRCISVVPGLAKHTSTPAAATVRMRLSAPFTAADLIRGRERGAARQDFSTAAAEPPRLLRTWICCGLVMNPRWSEYRPPPLFVSSNMKLPELENTLRIAFGFVLVALMVSSPLLQVAVWMATLSGAAGGPGVSVIVVVRVRSNHFAVIVTVVVALTADVVIGNALVDLPRLTSLSAGTWTSAGWLLDRWRLAPSVGGVRGMVPVAGRARVSVFGTTDTADSDGPAGRAGFTDRLAERGVLPTHAAIWTIVGGAAAFVEIGNAADCDPAGTITEDGTVAIDVSPLKSSTFVASGSGNASVTVPVAVAPSRTCDGSTESAEMLPAARAPVGSASMAAIAARAIDSASRRMEPPWGAASMPGGGGRGDRIGVAGARMLLPSGSEFQCDLGPYDRAAASAPTCSCSQAFI